MRRLIRREYGDSLLTLLAIVLLFTIFLFAPLQALGVFAVQAFAMLALLAIIASMLIISDHPVALGVMSIAFVANLSVFFIRLVYEWPYNLHLLAAAWFAISITLGAVVAEAEFRRGKVNYHRVIGAVLLYLLIAIMFGTLFIFVGLSL